GRDLGDLFEIRHRGELGEPMLTVRNLWRGRAVRDASFEVRRGEIVGVAGLVGSGRTELVRCIFGADRADKGEITVDGKIGLLRSPIAAIAQGQAMAPEDRKAQGLLVEMPIGQNIELADLAARGGFWLRPRRSAAKAREMVAELRIKAPRLWQPVGSLSGGNQQKIVLAKWLTIDPDLLILDEPTRGIDIGAKFELYKLIDRLAAAGKAVLLVSSELPEILALSDRVLVMRDGAIAGRLAHGEATEEAILQLAVRRREAAAAPTG
ncbi:MAG TPA: ATP-binding cassette domain-containing protein, partial [Thermomicrobiales bacterium]|nr:ATP-binding cassette domain-containing protein [Thermomicrobiales bacterium]